MDIELKKWGNSLGLRIPHRLATSLDLDDTTVVELLETEEGLVIRKKKRPSADLQALLATIPADFTYPDDVKDFVEGEAIAREML
ncbi:MAG: AbrB/MazE/SpoVT family DNA-binding domain-containing protein [Snowella sp.]|jgi:antitoxin MazE|nr:MAG: AbrB/MazE/SpoVT family DNA-binding domain-containing protein [Snowella sp.]